MTYTPVNGSASGYASLTATLTTSFTANATITAQYVADLNYSASSTVFAPHNHRLERHTRLQRSSNPILIRHLVPGRIREYHDRPKSLYGFTGTVSLSCAVPSAMTGASCSLASTSITPTTTTTLTVNTAAPSTVIGLFNSPRWLVPIGGAIFAAFFLLLIPTKRRRLKLAFGSLFLVLLAAALVACGGGSSSTTITTPRHAHGQLHSYGDGHQRQPLTQCEHHSDCAVRRRRDASQKSEGM